MNKNSKKHLYAVVFIFCLLIVFSLSSCGIFGIFESSEIKEKRNQQNELINSLQYQAIEADGVRYYPIDTPLLMVPYSLPPDRDVTIYKVIDGETDYSTDYYAEDFIDDYDKECLYFDEIVFKVDPSRPVEYEPSLIDLRIKVFSYVVAQWSESGEEVIIHVLDETEIESGGQIILLPLTTDFSKGQAQAAKTEKFIEQIVKKEGLYLLEIKDSKITMKFHERDKAIFGSNMNESNKPSDENEKAILGDIRMENINLSVGAKWAKSGFSVLISSLDDVDNMENRNDQVITLAFTGEYAKGKSQATKVEQFINQINAISSSESSKLVNFEKKGSTITMDFSNGEQITFEF